MRRSAGFSLTELMVATVISAIVIAAALALYARLRADYRVSERIARLQEQARLAMSVIEPDIELAGYYGFTNITETIHFVRGSDPGTVLAEPAELRQFPLQAGDPLPAPVGSLPSGAHACGVNFAIDVSMPVQGANDVFALGRSRTSACNPYQGRAQAGADTLTLRRVATRTSVAEANRIQIYAVRAASQSRQLLFDDGAAPGPLDADRHIHDWIVRSYYIAQDSVSQRNWPALRVKALTRSGSNAVFDDDEVMPGIEDLQVQFSTGTRYVDPDFVDLPRAQVVAVRIWLRVRSDEAEPGFADARTYRYANVVYTPAGAERSYRRTVISRTVAVRNARVM